MKQITWLCIARQTTLLIFKTKNKSDKTDERKVWYTGATRAKKSLHLLRTDYKYSYPIGSDYLIYVQEKQNDK
jgi:superfamily I DNA/RNA helicase